MDEERDAQDAQSEVDEPERLPGDSGKPDQPGRTLTYEEVQRANRKRLALIGLGTGAVMALIVLCCIVLLMLLAS